FAEPFVAAAPATSPQISFVARLIMGTQRVQLPPGSLRKLNVSFSFLFLLLVMYLTTCSPRMHSRLRSVAPTKPAQRVFGRHCTFEKSGGLGSMPARPRCEMPFLIKNRQSTGVSDSFF